MCSLSGQQLHQLPWSVTFQAPRVLGSPPAAELPVQGVRRSYAMVHFIDLSELWDLSAGRRLRAWARTRQAAEESGTEQWPLAEGGSVLCPGVLGCATRRGQYGVLVELLHWPTGRVREVLVDCKREVCLPSFICLA